MMRRILLAILAVACSSSAVLAHKPLDTSQPATKEEPIVIRDHQSSWVAYNRLAGSKDVDYYLLPAVKEGDPIDALLLIPVIDRLAEFRPVLALLGPGLPLATGGIPEETIADYIKITPPEGGVFKTSAQTPKIFFEPFTQTKYWERQSLHLTAPVSGQYYLAVFDPQGRGEKYVLSIGKQENWKFKDVFAFPRIWWQVRIFAEQERSTYVLVGVFLMACLSLTVILINLIRRHSQK